MKQINKFVITLLILSIYDIFITYIGINYFGLIEVNPIFNNLVHNNYLIASGFKVIGTCLLICIGYKCYLIYESFNINRHIKYMPFIFMIIVQGLFNLNNTLLVLG